MKSRNRIIICLGYLITLIWSYTASYLFAIRPNSVNTIIMVSACIWCVSLDLWAVFYRAVR